MPVPADPYTFADGPGNTASGEQINERFDPLFAALAGALDAENLLLAVRQQLGLTDPDTIRRGYAEVLTEQSAAAPAAALGDLATVGPQVTVNVPANGLVVALAVVEGKGSDVGYVGLSEDGGAVASSAAIMGTGLSAAFFTTMYPRGSGAATPEKRLAQAATFPSTPGAHTYKLVYGSAANTNLTWKNRKLWVWTIGF